eukprot:scaffold3568_cov16-Tisochrysis_lutea.AAC.2
MGLIGGLVQNRQTVLTPSAEHPTELITGPGMVQGALRYGPKPSSGTIWPDLGGLRSWGRPDVYRM